MAIVDFIRILEVKRYSSNTISTYCSMLRQAEGYFQKPISATTESELFDYIYHLIHNKKLAYSTQRQLISAFKLYYSEILSQPINLDRILPAKKPFKIPVVLSKKDVLKMIDSTKNLKHQCILVALYSGGIRVGELINLKIKDIDSTRMVISIVQGKGAKDRLIPLSQRFLLLLRKYYKEYQPSGYLFEGLHGNQYSTTSVNQIVKKAAKKAGITKNVSAHALRHCYATHLLENGTDIRVIQELLGHRSIKTTMIYTHVAKKNLLNVTSPFDYTDD